jgi:methionyl-tRNA synthetase
MSFYITTPIYYVNDLPHIGHAYTTVVADVLRRYRRLFGEETCFLTGVDEHGQKVQAAAEKRGLSPQVHCDELSQNFRRIWEELGVEFDVFFRTTDDFHKRGVQAALQQLKDLGDIYEAHYEGWYAQADEIFYTEKDLVNGKAPTGAEVVRITEKNYFFRMSKYQERLVKHIQENPGFIQPEFRKNEVLGFLRQPLGDLCISRPKSRLSWGIEIPFDRDYVTYVWFDALLNYATAAGYQQADGAARFEKLWSSADAQVCHLLGKDILTTHAVYWPTMLMALGVKLPTTLFAHGWWLSAGNEKMSKSKGNMVRPLDVKDLVGVEPFRFFLIRDIRLGSDAQFSVDLVVSRVNTELANNLGNLLSRTLSLVEKYFAGAVPARAAAAAPAERTQELMRQAEGVADRVRDSILAWEPQQAIGHVMDLMTAANQYLAERAPWKQAKEDLPAAGETLYTALEAVRLAGILLSPVMPGKAAELLRRVGWDQPIAFEDARGWGALQPGAKVASGDPLFPRVELPKEA